MQSISEQFSIITGGSLDKSVAPCAAQIFLFGAEFTKVYAHYHGSRARHATPTGVS